MAYFFVTRPAPAAERLAAALRVQRHSVYVGSALVLEPRPPDPSVLVAVRAAAHAADAWFFVSPAAVRFGWSSLAACSRTEQRCYAVGPATANALRACGVATEPTPQPGSAEQLLAMPALQKLAGTRALVVRGEGGLPTLPDTLRMRGAQVDLLEVYARVPCAPAMLRMHWQAATANVSARDLHIVISSGDGLRALLAGLSAASDVHSDAAAGPDASARRQGIDFLAELRTATLLVPSPRVAALARASGCARVIVCAGASDAAVIAALA